MKRYNIIYIPAGYKKDGTPYKRLVAHYSQYSILRNCVGCGVLTGKLKDGYSMLSQMMSCEFANIHRTVMQYESESDGRANFKDMHKSDNTYFCRRCFKHYRKLYWKQEEILEINKMIKQLKEMTKRCQIK